MHVISPISGNTPIPMSQVASQASSPFKSATPAHASSQDTVTLSHAAQQAAAAGDVDHDGDSH